MTSIILPVSVNVWPTTTSNAYDLLAEFLYDHGYLDAIPNLAYWQNFGNTLKYWNGEVWEEDWPVMNKYYLETVGSIPQ